jgi:uracil-DNA glycosylase family 4
MFLNEVQERKGINSQGSKNAKIAIIGDTTDNFDANAMRPFQGFGGNALESCLHSAGIIRGECYLTNVVKVRGDSKVYFDERKGTFTEKGKDCIAHLFEELSEVKANVIVTCGAMAFAALCNHKYLSRYRGYVFPASMPFPGPPRKVIPTYHPRNSLRGMYIQKYIISSDFRKAKEESEFPELRRPQRELIYNPHSVGDVLDWCHYYVGQEKVGFDLEVVNYEVACISFASTPELAHSLPIAGRWTLQEEMQVWQGIQEVLGNPNSIKVVQNGMFDIPFLLNHCNVEVKGPIHDTMVAHSILYPDLPKGLGFLGSIYCGSQAYWKDMVSFTNIKEEA